jgi:hypothetical protein
MPKSEAPSPAPLIIGGIVFASSVGVALYFLFRKPQAFGEPAAAPPLPAPAAPTPVAPTVPPGAMPQKPALVPQKPSTPTSPADLTPREVRDRAGQTQIPQPPASRIGFTGRPGAAPAAQQESQARAVCPRGLEVVPAARPLGELPPVSVVGRHVSCVGAHAGHSSNDGQVH